MEMVFIPLSIVGGLALLTSLRVMMEYQRGVIFRLGKLVRAKGPGLIFLIPFGIERMRRMDLRIVALDIAPQDTITRDNVSVKVNAVVYFRVIDPAKAVVEIERLQFRNEPTRTNNATQRDRAIRVGRSAGRAGEDQRDPAPDPGRRHRRMGDRDHRR